MTILGFALADDHVLIAADSGFINASDAIPPYGFVPHAIIRAGSKIVQVDTKPLAWALTGDASDVGHFASWINQAACDDWDDLAEAAGAKLSELNQNALARGHKLKTKKDQIQQSIILLAGNVGGRLEVVILGIDGGVHCVSAAGPRGGAVGLYSATFHVAWEAVRAFNPDLSIVDPATMHHFMTSLCDSIPGLANPVDVWSINRDGCRVFEPPGSA